VHERRKAYREARTRADHPHIGGLIIALRDAPQHERAWLTGQIGEDAVAEALERRTAEGSVILLHDRRMPGSRANIDHVAVAPTGVYVIDAKAWTGSVKVARPIFGPAKLLIDGRDRTKLIDGLDRQVEAVHAALADQHAAVPLHGVLCFTRADLPLLSTLKMRGHLLLYRKALAKRLNARGDLEPPAIHQLASTIADAFPPA
jgi:hypothetical protein